MDTTKSITLSQAFAHCASTGSYWLWIGIAVLFCAVVSFMWYKAAQKTEVNPYVKIFLAFVMLVAIVCSVFIRPVDVHVNTSTKMSKSNHWLGY